MSGPDLGWIERAQAAGMSREDIQAYLDAWRQAVPVCSPGAARTRRWREKKAQERESVTSDVTVTSHPSPLNGPPSLSPTPPITTPPLIPPSPGRDEVAKDVEEFFEAYNYAASERGWERASKLKPSRKAAIRRAISEAGSLERALDALADFANSKFAVEFGAGRNDREWRIGIDYVIRASKWTQILEGSNGFQAEVEEGKQGIHAKRGGDGDGSLMEADAEVVDHRYVQTDGLLASWRNGKHW